MTKSSGKTASGVAILLGLAVSVLSAQVGHAGVKTVSLSSHQDLYETVPTVGLFAIPSAGRVFTTPTALRAGTPQHESLWAQPFTARKTLFQVPLVGAARNDGFNNLARLVSDSSGISAAATEPVVTATKTDNVTPGTKKKPGDTIDYSVTIGNSSGGTDATGVQFSDTLDSNTTLVPGSFKSTPLAYPQTVTTDEDTAKTITLTGLDPDGGALTFSLTGASPSKGSLSAITLPTATSAQVTYTPTANLNGADTFGFRVTDSDSNTNDDVITVNITPVNDAPALTAGGALNYTENAAAAVIDNTITVSDIDNANLTSATVRISDNYVNGEDVLSFTNTPNITGIFAPATGTLTLTGADTVANYQAALRAVKYNNTSDNPSVLARTVTWTVSDGTDSSNSPTSTINVTAVNDAPTATPKAGVTYAAATNIQISFPASNGLLVDSTDPEGTTLSMDTAPFEVTTGAVVTLASDGGFTVDPPAGFTGTMSFKYRVQDSGSPAPNLFSAYTTVNVNVSGPAVFFADDDAAAGGTGTLARPLRTLTAANAAASASGNRIFLYSGNYTGGVTLASGALLYGQGVKGDSFDSVLGISPPSGSLARPSINGTNSVINTNGITVSTGNNTIAGITIDNTASSAIASGATFGTLTVFDTNITNIATSATRTGQALALSGGTLNGTFGILKASNATSGISLTNVAGTLTATGGVLENLTGNDINIDGGTITVTYPGSIANSAGQGRSVNITGKTTSGNVTLGGTITDFGSGINLVNNDGATITLGGNLTLNTGNNIALNATDGGTVNVTGTNLIGNSAALTNSAVKITDTTIGSGGVTFQRISTTGSSAPGINLSNTGNSGVFTVTGQGTTAGSGGSITNGTGNSEGTGTPGVRLNSVANVRLNNMNITGNSHSGIYGTTVNGFQLNNCNISNNGDSATTNVDETGVDITELTGSAINGPNPTSITNCTLSNNYEFQLQITNNTGTLTDFQLTSNTISKTSGGVLGNVVNFLGRGTSVMKLTASGGTFTGNANLGENQTSSTAIGVDSAGTSMTANVSGATFTNNNAGVECNTGPIATNLTFLISGNTFTGTRSHVIRQFNNGNAPYNRTVNGKILNNIIGNASTPSSGSMLGDGISIANGGTVNANLLIEGNNVREIGVPVTPPTPPPSVGRGIGVDTGTANLTTGTGTTALTIRNNTITNVYGGRGLSVSQNTAAGTVCSNVSGNTFAGFIGGSAGDGTRMRFRENTGATHNITQTSADNLAAVNTGVTVGQISFGGSPTFGQPTCSQPPLLFSADGMTVASDSGCGVGSTPAVATTSAAHKPVLRQENILTQDKLDALVQQAIIQWEATGLSAEQSEALREMKWSVADLPSHYLGQANGMTFTLDTNAGGNGWFIDTTSDRSEEFAGASLLQAIQGGAARRHVDALTAVMHEMGHILGLEDSYAPADRHDLMYGYLPLNERRYPAAGAAQGALPGTAIGIHRLAGPITMNIGDLPKGKSVTITFSATINSSVPSGTTQVSNQGTVSGSNFTSVQTDDTDVAGASDATVTPIFSAPTDIALSSSSVKEGEPVGTVVGTLSSTDADSTETHTYSLVAGDGDTDNGSFSIDGANLKTGAIFDHAIKNSYTIRVQSTDSGGLSFEKSFTIIVTYVNRAPVATANSLSVPWNTSTNGSLSGTDFENSTLTFAKASDPVNGTVTVDSTGTFTYTPTTGYRGPDSFTFTVNDGTDTSAPATITLTVKEDVRPGVVITAPANNASLHLSALTAGSIRGTATDNIGVNRVQVMLRRYRGTAFSYWNGTTFTPTYSLVDATLTNTGTDSTDVTWSLDTAIPASELDAGTYFLSALANDEAFNSRYSATHTLTLFGDSAAPAVAISAPTQNQRLQTNALTSGSIHGTATDNVGVARVRIVLRRFRGSGPAYWNGSSFVSTHTLVNTTLSSTGTDITWSLNSAIPAAQLDTGTYFLTAIANDAAGNTTHSTTREFTLFNDTTAPSVTIAAPTQRQRLHVSELVAGSINGSATDSVGVTQVKIVLRRFRSTGAAYWNGTTFVSSHTPVVTTLSGTSTNPTWSLNSAIPAEQLDVGTYFLTAVAVDAAGNTTFSTTREFIVHNDSIVNGSSSVSSSGSSAGGS